MDRSVGPLAPVLHLNKAYYPHTGGIEAVAQALAEGLSSRGEFACRVLACSPQRLTRRSVVNGVPATYAGSLGTFASLPLSPSFPLLLDRLKADIVHVHMPFPLADLSLRLLAAGGRLPPNTRLILHWHSDVVRQRWAMPIYGPLLHWLLKRADRILVATPNHVTSSDFLPPYQGKCRVIPYGIDPDRFSATPHTEAEASALRQRYGRPLALFVGRLVYYKGVEYLVRAMAQVPSARLLVVGTGPLEAPLRAEADQLGIGERVHFLGAVDDARLAALYHAADVFVLPSTEKSEAFGLVQLEAMVCGKPVISTDLPTGVTYVNLDGVTGLTVPVRDVDALSAALHRLLSDDELRHRLGRTAHERVLTHFTLDRMITQTEQLYREVLSEKLR